MRTTSSSHEKEKRSTTKPAKHRTGEHRRSWDTGLGGNTERSRIILGAGTQQELGTQQGPGTQEELGTQEL